MCPVRFQNTGHGIREGQKTRDFTGHGNGTRERDTGRDTSLVDSFSFSFSKGEKSHKNFPFASIRETKYFYLFSLKEVSFSLPQMIYY
jgi:hypothetical protein